jgi:hypothetical protein
LWWHSCLPCIEFPPKHQITLKQKGNRGKLTEDPIITQLRVADEEILAQMEKAETNFGEYNALGIKRNNFT